jgi:hypothetical protein
MCHICNTLAVPSFFDIHQCNWAPTDTLFTARPSFALDSESHVMRDHLKTALAVFIMFAGMTIALVIGAGFAMFCFAFAAHAQGLPLNREPGSTSPLHAAASGATAKLPSPPYQAHRR